MIVIAIRRFLTPPNRKGLLLTFSRFYCESEKKGKEREIEELVEFLEPQ